jgi:hypothetical protein
MQCLEQSAAIRGRGVRVLSFSVYTMEPADTSVCDIRARLLRDAKIEASALLTDLNVSHKRATIPFMPLLEDCGRKSLNGAKAPGLPIIVGDSVKVVCSNTESSFVGLIPILDMTGVPIGYINVVADPDKPYAFVYTGQRTPTSTDGQAFLTAPDAFFYVYNGFTPHKPNLLAMELYAWCASAFLQSTLPQKPKAPRRVQSDKPRKKAHKTAASELLPLTLADSTAGGASPLKVCGAGPTPARLGSDVLAPGDGRRVTMSESEDDAA